MSFGLNKTAAERRYRFAEWKDVSASARSLFVLGFSFRSISLPGCSLQHLRTITGADTRLTQSLWSNSVFSATVGIDAYECSSRDAARRALLEVLSHSESGAMMRYLSWRLGDIAFLNPRGYTIAFSRGNVVILMRTGGTCAVPLKPLAREVDLLLLDRGIYGDGGPEVTAFAVGQPGDDEPRGTRGVSLTLRSRDSVVKISCRGQIFRRGGELFYLPPPTGNDQIVLAAIRPGVRSTRRVLQLHLA
jgi:hypothetical protein